GAGASTVMWLKQERQATLKEGSRLVFSLTTPLILKPLNTPKSTAMISPAENNAAASGSE
ncbi:MAG TPA: hypothetical protein VHN81_07430, partial [Edaphobacter sp.]|nr:hypothetical protein [Edaphobacter sp.]